MGPGGVVRCVVAVAMVGAFMTACTTSADEKDVVSWAPEPVRSGELSVLAESDANGFRLHTESGEKTFLPGINLGRSEEHTSELQSLIRISYAVSCLKKKNKTK